MTTLPVHFCSVSKLAVRLNLTVPQARRVALAYYGLPAWLPVPTGMIRVTEGEALKLERMHR